MKQTKKFITVGVAAAALLVAPLVVQALQFDCNNSLNNTNSTATVGISNSLAAFTTNTVQQGILGLTRVTEVSLVATGKLSGAGTTAITLAGYKGVRFPDGTLQIDTAAGALISWPIIPRGTLTFVSITNISSSVIGALDCVVFTDLANGNNAILSNFGVNVCIKPEPVNLTK